jgi:hypothetical protein
MRPRPITVSEQTADLTGGDPKSNCFAHLDCIGSIVDAKRELDAKEAQVVVAVA